MCQWSSSWLMNLSAATFISNNQYTWNYFAIDILELCFTFSSAIYVGFGLYVISRSPVFGRNLILIVYTIIMNFYGMILLRVIVIFLMMVKGKSAFSLSHFFSCTSELQLFEYGRIGFFGSYFSALSSLSIERFIATIQLSIYEKENHLNIFLLSIAIQTFSFFFAYIININNVVPFEYIVLASVFVNLLIFVSFIFTERINFRWYKDVQSSPIGLYTLSERFQLSENVRTSRILRETLTLCFTLNIVCQVSSFLQKKDH
ncbi:Sre G protein-coupled chemoreceptor [Aphelenchoides besseyi]|nr:Sre G protein-coupled chemoreceptor [Aphelenchoides besseyi]